MDQRVKPAPHDIRVARAENPKMRERDLALQLGVSEAELLAAHVGDGVTRLDPRVNDVLLGLGAVGEVMALTRNDSAVHEKIGVYDKVEPGNHAALVLSENIDLRIFPSMWAHGFAVEKRDNGEVKHSLQFFDKAGEAVHKVHLRPASNLYAYQKLVAELTSENQSTQIDIEAIEPEAEAPADEQAGADELRDRWSRMTDTHQFFGLLKKLKLSRLKALEMVGEDYAWRLADDTVPALFHGAAEGQFPIMCFVGSNGCIQIHSGTVTNIKPMGPWINVLDETFHLHLRVDHIAQVWAVRKPTKDGHVTSVEVYDASDRLIIQFFGKRHEGEGERQDWRTLCESLPRRALEAV